MEQEYDEQETIWRLDSHLKLIFDGFNRPSDSRKRPFRQSQRRRPRFRLIASGASHESTNQI